MQMMALKKSVTLNVFLLSVLYVRRALVWFPSFRGEDQCCIIKGSNKTHVHQNLDLDKPWITFFPHNWHFILLMFASFISLFWEIENGRREIKKFITDQNILGAKLLVLVLVLVLILILILMLMLISSSTLIRNVRLLEWFLKDHVTLEDWMAAENSTLSSQE